MITFFNKLGNSWVAKIILGILALSMMAFWGLGGVSNLNMYKNDAVTIGKVSVSIQQIAQAFDRERKNLSAQIGGKYISPAQALEIGLLQKVLQEEITNQIKYQIKEDLGLAASNEAVQKYVENNPIFKDALGNFDKNIFYAFLSQRGLSETGLAYQLKDTLSFNHLKDTLSDIAYETQPINKLSYLSFNELRDVTSLFLKPENIKISETPSQEDLMNYYEGYSENFMKPEYRKIRMLQLTPSMMDQFIEIKEEDINASYEFEKNKYDQPEERELLQILFKTKEEADKALTNLSPANFEEQAQALGQNKEATYFGFTQKNQLAEALQEPIFNAQKGTLTQPIETSVGWQVFYIKDIKDAVKSDEAIVKSEIKQKLINDKAYDKLAEIARKVEDMLGEGKSLQETAQSLSLQVTELPLLDIAGTDTNGILNQQVSADLMKEIFTLNKGDISSLIEHNNGYLIGEVLEIDPVGVKPFESVKDDVIQLYITEKQKEKFASIVESLTQKAKNGTPLEQLANDTTGSFKLEKAMGLTRSSDHNLFKPHLKQIFSQGTGLKNSSFTLAPNNQGAIILTVDQIKLPDFNKKDIDLSTTKISEQQINANALNEAVFNDYLNKLKVKVNQKAINQLLTLFRGQE